MKIKPDKEIRRWAGGQKIVKNPIPNYTPKTYLGEMSKESVHCLTLPPLWPPPPASLLAVWHQQLVMKKTGFYFTNTIIPEPFEVSKLNQSILWLGYKLHWVFVINILCKMSETRSKPMASSQESLVSWPLISRDSGLPLTMNQGSEFQPPWLLPRVLS